MPQYGQSISPLRIENRLPEYMATQPHCPLQLGHRKLKITPRATPTYPEPRALSGYLERVPGIPGNG